MSAGPLTLIGAEPHHPYERPALSTAYLQGLSSGGRLVPVPDDAVETLLRWEAAGGHWEVVARSPSRLVVSLLRCDGGEEASRLASSSPALAAYIGERESSS